MSDKERLLNIKLLMETGNLIQLRKGKETFNTVNWLIEQAEIKLQQDSIVEALLGEETLHQQGLLEPEVSRLTKENHALKCELGQLKAKAKNKERARRRKDNYINRMQNQLIAIKEVNKKRNKQLEQARETLGFYANKDNYLDTLMLDNLNEEVDQYEPAEVLHDYGAKARQVLEQSK